MKRAFPTFYQKEGDEMIVVIAQLPLLIYIIFSFFRISAAACFFGLFGTKIGAAAGASTLGWIVGSLVGLIVSPFVRLVPRYSIMWPYLTSAPKSEINYPGAREIVSEGFDGAPIRTFVLPRPSLLKWQRLPTVLFLILMLLPVGLGWISLAWMALAFSPWGNAGLFTAKIAANLMLKTMYICAVYLPLALLIGLPLWLRLENYYDRRGITGT
jgi:hypothetical protein